MFENKKREAFKFFFKYVFLFHKYNNSQSPSACGQLAQVLTILNHLERFQKSPNMNTHCFIKAK